MFYTNSRDKRIIQAVKKANILMTSTLYRDQLIDLAGFDMADLAPIDLVGFMWDMHRNIEVEVDTYHPWYWRSKAYARFQPARPMTAQLSDRKLQRHKDSDLNEASIVGSIMHEWIHLIDYAIKDYSFGHGGNNPKGKENTAPYTIGRISKSHATNILL